MQSRHKALANADREKGDFLVTVTHELRNVISPIANALKVIELSADRATRSRAREMATRHIAQMNRLIDDLLDTSRISSGNLQLERKVVDVCETARLAIEDAKDRIDATGQSIKFEGSEEPLLVLGDDLRLAQVFGNLLTNAAKFGVPAASLK